MQIIRKFKKSACVFDVYMSTAIYDLIVALCAHSI